VDLNKTIVETKPVWEYKNKNGRTLHTFREADGHNYGTINVKKVFAKSSNVGFAKLAVEYYADKPQKFFDKLHSMGLFKKSMNLQIPEEASPMITEPKEKNWQAQLLPLTAIGYEVTLAPIHTLTFFNAVANNGKMMKPKFVKEIVRHGKVLKEFPDEVLQEQICSPKTLTLVREALVSVVDSGTAKHFKDARFTFAGKTGTAQRVITIIDQKTGKGKGVFTLNGQRKYQAAFAGYIPAETPKYSIIVVMYSPLINGNFYGASYAAPVFKEIADKIYSTDINWHAPIERGEIYANLPEPKQTEARQLKKIVSELDIPMEIDAKNSDWVKFAKKENEQDLIATKIETSENKVPSVVGMGLRDAVYLLEKTGLRVVASGKGRVKSQSIPAGSSTAKGAEIRLELN
jgi:cell division protein FtsI (penicillin-binding protein 3)